jgi:hypothetical protein
LCLCRNKQNLYQQILGFEQFDEVKERNEIVEYY